MGDGEEMFIFPYGFETAVRRADAAADNNAAALLTPTYIEETNDGQPFRNIHGQRKESAVGGCLS